MENKVKILNSSACEALGSRLRFNNQTTVKSGSVLEKVPKHVFMKIM